MAMALDISLRRTQRDANASGSSVQLVRGRRKHGTLMELRMDESSEDGKSGCNLHTFFAASTLYDSTYPTTLLRKAPSLADNVGQSPSILGTCRKASALKNIDFQ